MFGASDWYLLHQYLKQADSTGRLQVNPHRLAAVKGIRGLLRCSLAVDGVYLSCTLSHAKRRWRKATASVLDHSGRWDSHRFSEKQTADRLTLSEKWTSTKLKIQFQRFIYFTVLWRQGAEETAYSLTKGMTISLSASPLATMGFNRLVLPRGLLAREDGGGPGRDGKLCMPLALIMWAACLLSAAGALEEAPEAFEDEADADPNGFPVRWWRQRKEPGWLVGEHRQVTFAGGDDEWDDFLAITLVAEGREWSKEGIRLPFVVTSFWGVTKDCFLPEVVEERERGFKTALRRFEACILVDLLKPGTTMGDPEETSGSEARREAKRRAVIDTKSKTEPTIRSAARKCRRQITKRGSSQDCGERKRENFRTTRWYCLHQNEQ